MATPRFIYPPHPAPGMVISRTSLNEMENMGVYIAQRKFQGSHAVIWVYNNEFMIWNRQGEPFKTYLTTPNMIRCFQSLKLKPDTEYVFNGELLHTKVKNKKTGKQEQDNTIVLFDILFVGQYLNNETIEQRLALLRDLCHDPIDLEPKNQAFIVNHIGESQLWLAEDFTSEFAKQFENFATIEKGEDRFPLIEGLMLKLKGSKNTSIGTKPNDVRWMVRCRKAKEKMYML